MIKSDRRRPVVEALHRLTEQVLQGEGEVPPELLDFTSRLLDISARLRRLELNKGLYERFDGVVQSGPFAGMRLVQQSAWADGDVAPRLIGTYEQELHPPIERLSPRAYDTVVNLGCAEGYYAVGSALRFSGAQVHAFDSIPQALEICRKTAELNGVADRVHTYGAATAAALQSVLANARRALVICDIEGAEREVLDPAAAPALLAADLIVECHDVEAPGDMTALLHERFAGTHEVEDIWEGARDPNICEVLHSRSMLERWVAVCEFRGARQNWLAMEARSRKRGWRGVLGR